MMDCLFCKIITKEIPAHIVYEDSHTLAFLDIHPRAPGHALVIPKIHAETIIDLSEGEIQPVFSAVREVAKKLQAALQADGFTIGINHGKASGQEVDHLHIHIIPRWYSDKGFSIHAVVNNPSSDPLTAIAEKIRKC